MPNMNNNYNWSNPVNTQIPYSSNPYSNNYINRSYQSYNNCMKLASLYIVRDELKEKQGYGQYNYRYYPMYERGGRSGNSSPMYYENDDLMIKKDGMGMHDHEMMM